MLQKGPSKKTLATSTLILGTTATLTAAEEAVTEVLTETAEVAGEVAKEAITSENAAGLLSSLLEGGSSLVNGAWDGLSSGASYLYNNPGEAASGALETASDFIADNAFALGVTVGIGIVSLGGYKAYQNRDKIAEGFSGLAAKFGRRNAQTNNAKQETTSSASSSNDGNGDSANDGVTLDGEKRSGSPRPKPGSSSSSSD
ncbi:hypothetical protein [Candidatus Berkiella aquae]|uniref:Uncharacterized protein n=1 Tax=Candidatus Berkiella aquae TaxID=295108 RepID=A0A0Q9YLZ0_9GAMM|nr:hypothetical protein [Candidatus Berkiella aquae]MCS5710567.1 hypothetical protein [Candidatus Berkiella aquae]